MTAEEKRQATIKSADGFKRIPYRWGGDDPTGFDCSGFIIELLKETGTLPRGGDWTAEGLFQLFKDHTVPVPYAGCLVFFKRPESNRIIHVEFCLNDFQSIGASGGGSSTASIRIASEQNAYIKTRPIARIGQDIAGFVDPFIQGYPIK